MVPLCSLFSTTGGDLVSAMSSYRGTAARSGVSDLLSIRSQSEKGTMAARLAGAGQFAFGDGLADQSWVGTCLFVVGVVVMVFLMMAMAAAGIFISFWKLIMVVMVALSATGDLASFMGVVVMVAVSAGSISGGRLGGYVVGWGGNLIVYGGACARAGCARGGGAIGGGTCGSRAPGLIITLLVMPGMLVLAVVGCCSVLLVVAQQVADCVLYGFHD